MSTINLERLQPYYLRLDDGKGFVCYSAGSGPVRLPCQLDVHVVQDVQYIGVVPVHQSPVNRVMTLVFGDLSPFWLLQPGLKRKIVSMGRATWADPPSCQE